MTRRRFPAPRRGTSLIELVLLIAGVTIILSICGTFLHLLLRLDGAGRTSFDEATAVARLGRQFRQDVRSASASKVIKVKEAPAGLELTLTGARTIRYSPLGRGLVRTDSETGKPERHEGYRLDPAARVAFEADPDRVRLLVSRHEDAGGPVVGPVVKVEARLGKDSALARRAEDAK